MKTFFAFYFTIIGCVCQGKPQFSASNFFLCPLSGYQIPMSSRCNGVFDCPNSEDESDCSTTYGNVQAGPWMPAAIATDQYQPLDNVMLDPYSVDGMNVINSFTPMDNGVYNQYPMESGQYPIETGQYPIENDKNFIKEIPAGFIRLPDKFQQKKPMYTDDDYIYGGMYPQPYNPLPQVTSPCSGLAQIQPPQSVSCPIPWIKPSERYFFNSQTGSCQSFQYPGCGSTGDNQFRTFSECSKSCLTSSSCSSGRCEENYYPDNEIVSAQPILPSSNGPAFYCYDGTILPESFVCNNIQDCYPYGEDESNCPSVSRPPTFVKPTKPKIMELNYNNFQDTLNNNPRILVEFYDPECKKCIAFNPEYQKAEKQAKKLGLGILFTKVNVKIETGLKQRFNVNKYPKILYWDNNFPGGVPRQYYKSYGLTSDGLILWLQKQISSVNGANTLMPPCSRMGEFQCGDSLCLPEEKVCDGVLHCVDGSDENMCAAPPTVTTESTATTTTTTPASIVPGPEGPNENPDPGDQGNVCDFRCGDGSCQPIANRCDGKVDCSDGIDEANCGICKRTQHTCTSDRTCVDYLKRCDGYYDCPDRSDEYLCKESKCAKTEFICADTSCVSFAVRCDGNFDCPDKSDEMLCPERCNSTTQFTCNNGYCIDIRLKCDGVPDCHDSTDELSCDENFIPGQCDPDREWECSDRRSCIDIRRRCDGYPDCADLSDEDAEMCPKIECNGDWQFQCQDRQRCIDKRRRCDGYRDCYDSSDEYDCLNVECDYWQYKCASNGICIDSRRRCDGRFDCEDGSDEDGCNDENEEPEYISSIRPTEISVGVENTTTTTTEQPLPEVETVEGYPDNTNNCSHFCPAVYKPVCSSEGKTYANECEFVEKICLLTMEDPDAIIPEIDYYGECTTLPGTTIPCENHQWTCDDGSCIDFEQQCDEQFDCPQGEDEKFCTNGTQVPLGDDYFKCKDGQVLRMAQRCDNFPDCRDGEDERDCEITTPDALPQKKCDSLDEYTCKDGTCISKDARCNGIVDCIDESDEFDCPSILPIPLDDNTDYLDSWFGKNGNPEYEEELPMASVTEYDPFLIAEETTMANTNLISMNETGVDTIPSNPNFISTSDGKPFEEYPEEDLEQEYYDNPDYFEDNQEDPFEDDNPFEDF